MYCGALFVICVLRERHGETNNAECSLRMCAKAHTPESVSAVGISSRTPREQEKQTSVTLDGAIFPIWMRSESSQIPSGDISQNKLRKRAFQTMIQLLCLSAIDQCQRSLFPVMPSSGRCVVRYVRSFSSQNMCGIVTWDALTALFAMMKSEAHIQCAPRE